MKMRIEITRSAASDPVTAPGFAGALGASMPSASMDQRVEVEIEGGDIEHVPASIFADVAESFTIAFTDKTNNEEN